MGGPFGNPNRGASVPKSAARYGNWERAISMHRTAWSYVAVARPAGLSLTWFSFDAPHGSVYLPLYATDDVGPPSFSSPDCRMSKFSTNCAWWAFNVINQYQDLNFQLINKDVKAKAVAIETKAVKNLNTWEASHESTADVVKLSNQFVEATIADWWQYRDDLHVKFGRYKITYNESETGMKSTHYPEWWVNSSDVGYKNFKPAGPNTGGKCVDLSTLPSTPSRVSSTGYVVGVAITSAVVASLIVGCIAYQLGRHAAVRTGARAHLEIGMQSAA